jgi:hypothetical protein
MQESQDLPSSWFEGTLGTWWEHSENMVGTPKPQRRKIAL